MTQKELRSYRLNSSEEPTDEMLHAIMLGVQETARQSTIKAEQELNRRFTEAKREIEEYRSKQKLQVNYATNVLKRKRVSSEGHIIFNNIRVEKLFAKLIKLK